MDRLIKIHSASLIYSVINPTLQNTKPPYLARLLRTPTKNCQLDLSRLEWRGLFTLKNFLYETPCCGLGCSNKEWDAPSHPSEPFCTATQTHTQRWYCNLHFFTILYHIVFTILHSCWLRKQITKCRPFIVGVANVVWNFLVEYWSLNT